MKTYQTKAGDMWDIIARAQLGGEQYTSVLMEANPQHIDTTVFKAGVVLTIPEVSIPIPTLLPPWKR